MSFGEEDVEPREESIMCSEEIDAGITGDELDARLVVHRPADRRRNHEVAVGGEGPPEGRDCDVPPQIGCAGHHFVRIVIADFITGLEVEPLRGPREQSGVRRP